MQQLVANWEDLTKARNRYLFSMLHSKTKRSKAICEKALQLGFVRAGITTSEPLAIAEALFEQWVVAGYHGNMTFMENTAQRVRPTNLLASAKSVVCVAWPYPTRHGQQPMESNENPCDDTFDSYDDPYGDVCGDLAKYAHSQDYHRVLHEKLSALALFCCKLTGRPLETVVCVDSMPLAERALALRAGVAMIGKSNMAIVPEVGTQFVLGELLLNLELEPTASISQDPCGNCTACLDACPTKALVKPFVLDATKCIAYCTVELKGTIPVALRQAMGSWIFGCDICQNVCPWNNDKTVKQSQQLRILDGSGDAPWLDLLLCQWLALSNKAYQRLVQKSCLAHASRNQLARNAAIALGNLQRTHNKNDQIVSLLSWAQKSHPSKMVQEHARWALRQQGFSKE